MNVGLKAILMLVAIILFVIAALSDDNWPDLIAFGLACVAAGLIVEELGVDRRFGGTAGGTRHEVR